MVVFLIEEICGKMFVLAEMKDTVRIKPWHFGVDLREAVTTKLNKKLANKVRSSFTNKTRGFNLAWYRQSFLKKQCFLMY